QLEGRAEAAGRLEITGRRDPLCGRVTGIATGAKGLGSDPTRRERGLPRALELEERGQLPLGLRQLERSAASAVALSGFAPRSSCFAEVTAQLGVLAQSIECTESGRLVLSLLPELNPPPHHVPGGAV